MNEFKKIAKRRVLQNKDDSVFLICVIAMVVALFFITLNLSINYLDYFTTNSGTLTGQSFGDVLKSGFRNISTIFVVLFTYIATVIGIPLGEAYYDWMQKYTNAEMTVIVGGFDEGASSAYVPVFNNADAVFSADAMMENMPAMIIIMILVVFVISRLVLSTVFSATRRERNNFFIRLVASGTTKKQLKVCVFYETAYYCMVAFPIGIVIGIIGLYLTKFGAWAFFNNLAKSYPGVSYEIDIGLSIWPIFITAPIIFLLVFRYMKKAIKKISIKTVASDIKKRFVVNSGISVFSEDPESYVKRGLQHYIATRNFANNAGKYLRIILMTLIYSLVISTTYLILTITRSYNETVFAENKLLLSMNFSLEIYFMVITVGIVIITMLAIFCAVSANINSNTSEYALLRSGGASMETILDSVRKEGKICVGVGIGLCIATFIAMFFLIRLIFIKTVNASMIETNSLIAIIGVSLLVFILSVVFTTKRVEKKVRNMDLVSILKSMAY